MNTTIPERKATTEEISGLIERVTFHNDENGFCVLRVKVRDQRDEVTALGSLPSVTAGEWLEAEGWWVRDKEHGLQFKTKLMKTVPPTTLEGIERYLSSGLVKGIGPVLAKKLVGKFGAEVIVAICLGLRRSELAGLKWSDFDRLNQEVMIQRSVIANRVDALKTKKSNARLRCPLRRRSSISGLAAGQYFRLDVVCRARDLQRGPDGHADC